jgi:hypothetical protein
VKPLTCRHTRRLALTATMLALCAASLQSGEAVPPAQGDAAAELERYAAERAAHQAGGNQAAEFHYVRGMRAKEENRLSEAVRELTLAVDYAPANETYVKELAAVRALAGLERDPRSQQIDRLVDEAQVKDQELWNEAQAKKEAGVAAMQSGDFNLADRSFQMALVRLESLPFADERAADAKPRTARSPPNATAAPRTAASSCATSACSSNAIASMRCCAAPCAPANAATTTNRS